MSLPMTKSNYTARACGAASISRPSANGNHQIAIPLEVTQGELAGETITWIAAFHGTADKKGMTGVDRIIESLQHMGWIGDEVAELTDVSTQRAQELLPHEIEIVCEPDTYEGETKLKVKWVNKLGGGRFTFKEPLTGGDLKAFSAQLKGTIRSAQGAQRASKPANGAGGSQPVHPNAPGARLDDDIPFVSAEIAFDIDPIARVIR